MNTKYKRQLSILLTAVLIEYFVLLSVIYSVKADNFFPIANIEETQLQVKSLFSIERFPERPDVTFDSLSVVGVMSNQLLQKTYSEIEMLKEEDLRQVAVPGGTILNLLWVPENRTGHQVYIHNSWLFGKEYEHYGQHTVSYYDIAYFTGGQLFHRYGLGVQLGPLGNILPEHPYKSRVLDTFVVGQPIEILSYAVSCREKEGGSTDFEYILKVKNDSSLPEVITISEDRYTIAANEERIVSGIVELSALVPREITVAAQEKVCFDDAGQLGGFWVARNDLFYWFWGGVQSENFDSSSKDMPLCITRIAYKISLGTIDECVTRKRYRLSVNEAERVIQLTPPETARFHINLVRQGGDGLEEDYLKIHVPVEVLPFVAMGEGDTVEDGVIVRRLVLVPEKEVEIQLVINFPDKIPRGLFELKRITFEFHGLMQEVELLPIISDLSRTEGRVELWCESEWGKVSVKYENLGNVLAEEVEQVAIFSKEVNFSVNGGQKLYVKQIVLRYEKQFVLTIFNRKELEGGYFDVGGARITFPACVSPSALGAERKSTAHLKTTRPIVTSGVTDERSKIENSKIDQDILGAQTGGSPAPNYCTYPVALAVLVAIARMAFALYKRSFARNSG